MATHLRDDISIEELSDTCDELSAGLELDEETKHLAPTWIGFTSRADKLVEKQHLLDRRLRRARVGINIREGRWDSTAAAFGRTVVNATDGKRDRDPYLRFFKDHTPSAAQDLSPEKKVALSTGWIQELQRIPDDTLVTPWVSNLKATISPLSQSLQERSDADKEQQPLDITKSSLLQEVNKAIDLLEGDLLKLFPGQPKRVSSFLSPTRPVRASRAKQNGEKA